MIDSADSKQHIPIFVSSTYEDLKEYRRAINETLNRLETIIRGMEYFGSKPGTPKKESLKVVRSCKVFIGIFAMRYGSIDEETGKSITHLEYEEAQLLELPTLIYLIDEERQPVLPKFVDTGENAKKLMNLKTELKRQFTVSFFTTPEDLAKRISQDLPPILEKIVITTQKKDELALISVKKSITEVVEEAEEEKGFLDFIVEGTEAAEKVTTIMSEMANDTLDIGSKFTFQTERIQKLSQNPGPGTTSQIHKIALIMSTDMNSYSEKIETNLTKLEGSIDILDKSYSGYIAWVELKSEEDRKQTGEFKQSIAGLLNETKAGLENTKEYRNSVDKLKGISKDITRASRRLCQALDGVISAMEKVKAFCEKTLILIDEKLREL